jgi:hypothetical protein
MGLRRRRLVALITTLIFLLCGGVWLLWPTPEPLRPNTPALRAPSVNEVVKALPEHSAVKSGVAGESGPRKEERAIITAPRNVGRLVEIALAGSDPVEKVRALRRIKTCKSIDRTLAEFEQTKRDLDSEVIKTSARAFDLMQGDCQTISVQINQRYEDLLRDAVARKYVGAADLLLSLNPKIIDVSLIDQIKADAFECDRGSLRTLAVLGQRTIKLTSAEFDLVIETVKTLRMPVSSTDYILPRKLHETSRISGDEGQTVPTKEEIITKCFNRAQQAADIPL